MTVLRTLLSALVAVLVAASGLVLVATAPAFACSCATADTPAYVKWADVVVVGEVTEITPPPEREVMSSTDPVTYTIVVDEVLKGETAATVEVRSALFGASCGLEGIQEGEDYLVYANHQDVDGDRTGELQANLCGGTRLASGSSVAEVEAVTGPGRPPEPGDPPAAESESAPAPAGTGATTAPEPTADAAGIPGWAWGAGAAAVLLGFAGLLVARRRQSAA